MARITWQNVAAPDFRGVGQNYETMSRLLGNAAQAGEGMLDVFRNAHQQAADRNILQRQLAATDPSQYDPSAVIGSDGAMASMDTLRGVGSHVDTLINRQVTRDTHGQNLRDWDWTNTGRDQAVANADFLNEARARAMSGDLSFMRDPRMAGLRPDIAGDVMSSADGFATSNLGRQSTAQSMEQSAYRHGRQVRADELSDMSAQVYADMRANGFDLDTWDAYLASRTDLPPEVANAAHAEMMRLSTPVAGGAAPGMGGGMSGGAVSPWASAIPFSETRNYVSNILSNAGPLSGGTSREIAQQLLPHLIQQESDGRDDVVSPKGARGRTQVMPATGADPGYGVRPMQNQTPQEYERFAVDYLTAMLDRYNGDPEKALAAYNAGPGRADEWNRTLPSGRSPGQILSQTLDQGATEVQRNIGTVTNEYISTLGNHNSANEAANLLAERMGGNANPATLLRRINDVMEESAGPDGRPRVNAAQAAAVIEMSLDDANRGLDLWGLRNVIQGTSTGGDRRIVPELVTAAIEDITSGAMHERLRTGLEERQRMEVLSQAEQRSNMAQQRLMEAMQRAERRPGIAQHIPRLQEEANHAAQAVDALLSSFIGSAQAMDTPQPVDGQADEQVDGLIGGQTSPVTNVAQSSTAQPRRESGYRGRTVTPDEIREMVPNPTPGGLVERAIERGEPVSRASVEYWNATDNSSIVQGVRAAPGALLDSFNWWRDRMVSDPVNAIAGGVRNAAGNLPAYRSQREERERRGQAADSSSNRAGSSSNRAVEVLQTTSPAPSQTIGGYGYEPPPVTQESTGRVHELIRNNFLERAAVIESMPESNLENYARGLQPQNASMGEVVSMLRAIKQTNDPDRKIALMRQLQDSVRNPVL